MITKSRISERNAEIMRLAKLEDDEKAEERREDVSLARNANTINGKAYRLSKWAILISAAAFLWSIFSPD